MLEYMNAVSTIFFVAGAGLALRWRSGTVGVDVNNEGTFLVMTSVGAMV